MALLGATALLSVLGAAAGVSSFPTSPCNKGQGSYFPSLNNSFPRETKFQQGRFKTGSIVMPGEHEPP